jgi:urease accessory protein
MAADTPSPSPSALPPAFEAYAGQEVPQAAPGSPGKDGRLALEFGVADGETHLVRDFARAPFHVSGTLGHDPLPAAATVYTQSPTGSVAQGDRHEIDVRVGPDAAAHVSTGSATKVLSMEANYARATVSLAVESGGHLDYVPEATILNPDARFCQSVTLDVAADATAVLGEIVVPGRLARGERFDFERYHSRTRIVGPDGLLAADAVDLAPAERDPGTPGVLDDFAVHGTLFVVAPAVDLPSDRLHEAVTDGADGRSEAGATALPDGAGVLVRALGDTTEPVRERLHAAWDRARRDLVGAPAPERRK